jgi:diguanylate cyclase (GGDEF)-like protein
MLQETMHDETRFFINQCSQELVDRWGGEEFLIVFPRVEIETAFLIIDELRQKVCQTLEIQGRFISFSAGVVQAGLDNPMSIDELQHELIKEADYNLYQAKGNGRNQVVAIPSAGKIHNPDYMLTPEGTETNDLLTEG